MSIREVHIFTAACDVCTVSETDAYPVVDEALEDARSGGWAVRGVLVCRICLADRTCRIFGHAFGQRRGPWACTRCYAYMEIPRRQEALS